MSTPVRLPELHADPVRFGLWLVEPGEHVYAGDRLAEVLIEGAVIDVVAPITGRLARQLAWPRDVLVPGQLLAVLEEEPQDA